MRAWQLDELGEPIEQLSIREIPDPPPPPPGHVQIAIAAAGIAFPDVLRCHGAHQTPTPLPFVPGAEAAGTIVAVGDGVTGLVVGDRVMIIGGGLSELVNVRADDAWHAPASLSLEAAAAVPVNFGTSWYALHDRAHLAPGETVLVTGAAGGAGSSAVQLAKAAGATVIAVAGGDTKCALAREIGADHVVDHHATADWVDIVREYSDGGVDVAYDAVGGDTTHKVRRCMGWDGRLLIIGFVAGIPDIPTNHILLKSYSVVGVFWGAACEREPGSRAATMRAVSAAIDEHGIQPFLFPPFPFSDGAKAIQDLAERQIWGKAIVRVGE